MGMRSALFRVLVALLATLAFAAPPGSAMDRAAGVWTGASEASAPVGWTGVEFAPDRAPDRASNRTSTRGSERSGERGGDAGGARLHGSGFEGIDPGHARVRIPEFRLPLRERPTRLPPFTTTLPPPPLPTG